MRGTRADPVGADEHGREGGGEALAEFRRHIAEVGDDGRAVGRLARLGPGHPSHGVEVLGRDAISLADARGLQPAVADHAQHSLGMQLQPLGRLLDGVKTPGHSRSLPKFSDIGNKCSLYRSQ